jgi:type I restriction enzyme S subunit
MNKYTYKDSGIEWLGDIPMHWSTDRVKDVSSLRDEKIQVKSANQDYLELENLEQGTGRVINFKDTLEVGSKVMRFKKGDVLFGKLRPYLEKYYLTQEDGFCTGEILAIEAKRIDNTYLKYFIGSPNFIKQCDVFSYGAKMPRVNWQTQIGTFEIPLPPLQEQKSIAKYLDKVTTKLDRIIAIKQEQLLKMENYYDSKIHEYITKGNNNTKLIASGIDWQGEVPKHWKKEKLFRLADKMGSGGTPKSTNQDYYGGEIDWIQSGDLNDWIVSTTKKTITEEALNNSSAKMFKKGTLLIAMYGATIGKLGVMGMDAATNQACCAIQVGSKLNSDFLFYLLYDMRKYLISQGYGGGQPNISQETLKQQYFYHPAKTEQIEIVNQIKDFRSKQEIIRDNVKSQIETLQAYRKSLIHECVTGKKQITTAIKN